MLRVTTIHASSATASAAYYTRYLTGAPGEAPGVWTGRQAAGFGLSGTVKTAPLERLLSGHHPIWGTQLGYPLNDRKLSNGRVVKAVAGFDATFSAPKSLSVLWALTGDERLLEAHDVAVAAALAHLERFGSTTRIRYNDRRRHPDTNGLTIAVFRQTTSRADDPQLHTHAVISAKVQTAEGHWYALDARYLKRHQRMLGGLYQSVLRNELSHRFGVDWASIVKGQAEIAGVPDELRDVFSKRGKQVDEALKVKVDEFRQREGRSPSRFERAALEREAAVDTRGHKSGLGVVDLATRWQTEAADVGWTADRLVAEVERAGAERAPADPVTFAEVIASVSSMRSSWGRADVVQAICDRHRPASQLTGQGWADFVERAVDGVLERCVDLDPPTDSERRKSDGRSEWVEPTSPRFTSDAVLSQEEHIITWAIDAQIDPPAPSETLDRTGLDVLQTSAAAAVAGDDRLVLVVGPAGAGKTRMLAASVTDLHAQHRSVFGVAPTAKAARVLQRDTGMPADTVAKLLHEWQRADRPPRPDYQLAAGTTVVVDEAGMLSTPALHHLVTLAETHKWRLVLVGDHRQLQAVGRGGLFAELCTNGRVEELESVHRFTHEWEAAASLKLRAADPRALDAYEAHDRIIPGTFDDHLSAIAETWIQRRQQGDTVAVVASTNDHVDSINQAVQAARLAAGDLDPNHGLRIAGGEHAYVGDVVVTRRNDRTLLTTAGEPVRNRETWTVMAIGTAGSVVVTREHGHGSVEMPAEYVHDHVRLGYAATAHGYQSDTVDHSVALVSVATTRRGLYVAATRGRDDNLFCVVTDSDDVAEARETLDAILAYDRADIPAVTQRRTLAEQQPHQPHPMRTPRCEMPAWFEPLRAELRSALDITAREAIKSGTRHDQLFAAVRAADRDLIRIEAATAPARNALAAATNHYEQACRRHALAEQRLAASGIRGRRAVRRDVAEADADLERASEQLRIARQYTGPHIDRYRPAKARAEAASDNLHRHDQRARLRHTFDQLPLLQHLVEAVDTWGRWARGDVVAVHQLHNTVTLLTSVGRRHRHADRFSELAQAIRGWADHNDFELPIPAPQIRQVNGLEIGL